MNQLESIFEELSISQYLDAFVDQGFDSWDTILDITESDLDALGVKLGHRRKLQRRIANYRGQTPAQTLASPARTSIEDGSGVVIKPVPHSSVEIKEAATTAPKRKYRRHPKPDEKAPERPPSAYVLFSNKMREDLKDQNLSFTEIAKLVGENWQNLDRTEKAPYETRAQEAKEKYTRDLNAYKKTDEYRKYSDYLQEFRKRQAVQERNSSKRIKMSEPSCGSSTSGQSTGPSRTTSATGSGSDSHGGSEPPPSRHQRFSSVISQSDPHSSPITGPHGYQQPQADDKIKSPIDAVGRFRGYSNPTHDDPSRRSRGLSNLQDGILISGDASSFPWLSSSSSGAAPTITESPEGGHGSLTPSLTPTIDSRANSGSSKFWSGPPSLRTEPSSGSVSSISPYPTPRTPSEASVPLYTLLSSKPEGQYSPNAGAPQTSQRPTLPSQPSIPIYQHPGRPPGEQISLGRLPCGGGVFELYNAATPGIASRPAGFPTATSTNYFPPLGPSLPKLREQQTPTDSHTRLSPDSALDGMSALLRASDIVGRPNE